MYTVRVPATTANLGPGFDCLGMALSCHNSVSFEFMDVGLHITLPEQDRRRIPADEKNLIYRVFCRTLERYGKKAPGLRFSQVNNIPAMRGMGSSAACVVAAVAMANVYLNGTITQQELLDICTEEEGHPDNILPAVLGGVTVGCLDGKTVRFVRMEPPKGLYATVFIPDFPLSTKKARKALPETVALQDAVFNLSHASLLTAALAAGDIALLQHAMQDRLHQPYRKALVPEYDDIVAICQAHGALATCLSGAGPTMIAFLSKQNTDFPGTAARDAARLKNRWEVRPMQISQQGYTVEEGE